MGTQEIVQSISIDALIAQRNLIIENIRASAKHLNEAQDSMSSLMPDNLRLAIAGRGYKFTHLREKPRHETGEG